MAQYIYHKSPPKMFSQNKTHNLLTYLKYQVMMMIVIDLINGFINSLIACFISTKNYRSTTANYNLKIINHFFITND